MISFAIAFIVSLVSSLFILRIAHLQGEWGIDQLSEDPRKLHRRPVPRIGGAGIMVAALVASVVVNLRNAQAGPMLQIMILTALPSFAGGIADDLSGRVSIRLRLFLMMVAASLAALLFQFTITRTDLVWLDGLLQSHLVLAYLLTLVALIGITNGMNLIDGLNGLAGMASIVMFLGLASAALAMGDAVVLTIAMTMAGAIAGISWSRLLEQSSVTYPCLSADDPGHPVIFDDHFPTPTGRVKLVTANLIPANEQPDAAFPWVLITGRQLEHWHTGSMTRRAQVLDDLEPEATVSLSAASLQRLGLRAGDWVRVISRRGEVTLRTREDDGTPDMTLFIPFAYREAAANLLTNAALDPVGKIPELKYCAVAIEPAAPH